MTGVLKKKIKIGGNVEYLKACRLIPLTHPLLGHFTITLNTFLIHYFIIESDE
jgi:hypothetical protein